MFGFFSVGSISHRHLWVVGGARTENLHKRMRHRAHCQPILYRIRARLVVGGPAPGYHICGRHLRPRLVLIVHRAPFKTMEIRPDLTRLTA